MVTESMFIITRWVALSITLKGYRGVIWGLVQRDKRGKVWTGGGWVGKIAVSGWVWKNTVEKGFRNAAKRFLCPSQQAG
jgi:hypothetical protein